MVGTKKKFVGFIILPCVVIALSIFLFGKSDSRAAVIVYVNLDKGSAGAHLITELSRNDSYVLKEMDSEEQLKASIIHQKAKVGMTIPSGFSEQLKGAAVPKVQLYDLSISEESITLQMSLDRIIGHLSSTAQLSLSQAKDADTQTALLNKTLEQVEKHQVKGNIVDLQLYPKPGLSNITGFTLMFMMGLITSSITLIVNDRRQRTMARMFTAPIRSYQIALGNFMGSFLVGLVQIVLVIAISRWVLGYDYGIPFGTHVIILGAFMLVAMGIASTVAGLVRNPRQAGMLNSIIITPTSMLGGCFWPLSIMPDYLQKVANFIPQKWAIEAIDTVASGGTITDIWLSLSILALMAVTLLAIGSTILRPSEAGSGA
nr:ABC transporter permease [Paenibacillus sediminis]